MVSREVYGIRLYQILNIAFSSTRQYNLQYGDVRGEVLTREVNIFSNVSVKRIITPRKEHSVVYQNHDHSVWFIC